MASPHCTAKKPLDRAQMRPSNNFFLGPTRGSFFWIYSIDRSNVRDPLCTDMNTPRSHVILFFLLQRWQVELMRSTNRYDLRIRA